MAMATVQSLLLPSIGARCQRDNVPRGGASRHLLPAAILGLRANLQVCCFNSRAGMLLRSYLLHTATITGNNYSSSSC